MFEGFVFPGPTLAGGRKATISDGWHQRDSRFHYGVDIDYRRLPSEPVGLPYGTQNYYVPPGTVALAAGPGVVSIASQISSGGYVQIDHGGGVKTQYMHLAHVAVSQGQRVSAGDVVGTIGHDIRPGEYGFNHLHFELMINGSKVDPEAHGITGWANVAAPLFDWKPLAFLVGFGLLTYYVIG